MRDVCGVRTAEVDWLRAIETCGVRTAEVVWVRGGGERRAVRGAAGRAKVAVAKVAHQYIYNVI